jgi:hypothetical protein
VQNHSGQRINFLHNKHMPKDNKLKKNKTNKITDTFTDNVIISPDALEPDSDDDTPIATNIHEELDEEIQEALNIKKKKKVVESTIDYIPELERDTFDSDY